MEYFDIVDLEGNPVGGQVDRITAHREGVLHRTSHVWIVRKKEGKIQILLQKRCKDKDSFPGCYDISSAGHIHAGMGFDESAIRELKEELDVDITEDQLIDCGLINIEFDEIFHGEPFHDRQVSKVYLLWLDMEESEFKVQEEELEAVCWMDYIECKEAVKNNTIPHCIQIEELEMLEKNM